jgi:hypothetical protein
MVFVDYLDELASSRPPTAGISVGADSGEQQWQTERDRIIALTRSSTLSCSPASRNVVADLRSSRQAVLVEQRRSPYPTPRRTRCRGECLVSDARTRRALSTHSERRTASSIVDDDATRMTQRGVVVDESDGERCERRRQWRFAGNFSKCATKRKANTQTTSTNTKIRMVHTVSYHNKRILAAN